MSKTSELDSFKASLTTPLPEAVGKYVFEGLYIIRLNVSPEEIWPFITDTSRMNKELGFGPRQETEINGETHVSTVTLGKNEEWIEKPWIWVHIDELQNHRVFFKGWMIEHRGVFKVRPLPDGCEVQIYFRWTFPNLFRKILFSFISSALKKNFVEFFKNKESLIKELRSKEKSADYSLIEPVPPYETFLNYLKSADDLDLDRIKLKKVSKVIKLPVDLLMNVSHVMVKEGLLSLSWDVVCPHCRGSKSENPGLSYLEEINHCNACDIDFSIGPEESIEVVFHPTEKLRKVSRLVYCAAEPAKKKHIKLYQPVESGESKEFALKLSPGSYRLRKKGSEIFTYVQVQDDSPKTKLKWDGNSKNTFSSGPLIELNLINNDASTAYFTFEEAWWQNDSLVPGEVLSHPTLRDLFSEDHLKIGVKLNVGDQVIMFTDIVGSTPFYKTLGDAIALKAVKEHYDEVREIIEQHQGVVVKYIGDAVMAAFLDLNDAMNACVQIQKKFPPHREDTPIRLRASLHRGPILCANVNVGLDYFGNTVNQSAKIQKWADAFEVAMAESDWEVLRESFKDLNVKNPVFDEKLGLEVRVVSVF